MKQKKQTKNKKIKSVKTRRSRTKSYPAEYLAIVLAVVLLIEGMTIGATTSQDWIEGASVLDMSELVDQTSSDLSFVFSPIAKTFSDVNEFYKLAAVEMAHLLDVSDKVYGLTFVVGAIDDFYNQAAVEMAILLDFSNSAQWPAQVAGAWTENTSSSYDTCTID